MNETAAADVGAGEMELLQAGEMAQRGEVVVGVLLSVKAYGNHFVDVWSPARERSQWSGGLFSGAKLRMGSFW